MKIRIPPKPTFTVETERDQDYLIVRVTATSRRNLQTLTPEQRGEILSDVADRLSEIAGGLYDEAAMAVEEEEADAREYESII